MLGAAWQSEQITKKKTTKKMPGAKVVDKVVPSSSKRKADASQPELPTTRKSQRSFEKQPITAISSSSGVDAVSQLLKRPSPTQIPRLDMIHHKEVRWENNQAFVGSAETTFIDRHSGIYDYGGQVHRVTVFGDQNIDCMICDPFSCKECHKNVGEGHGHQSIRVPLVHASDTGKKEGKLIFDPTRKEHTAVPAEIFARKMEFQTCDGPVMFVVVVCDYVRCKVCSGSEHIRVQENKDLDKAKAARR